MSKIESLKRTIPSEFKPNSNPNWKALLDALGAALNQAVQGITDAKEQLFVLTAVGKFLEEVANNYGVRKPSDILITDTDFRTLIPLLSWRPKQVRQTIKEVLDIFFGIGHPDVIVQEVNPNELVIQIPATVPVIRDELIGTHHFHGYGGFLSKIDDTAEQVIVNLDADLPNQFVLNRMKKLSDWTLSADISNTKVVNIYTPSRNMYAMGYDKSGGTEDKAAITWDNQRFNLSSYKYLESFLYLPDISDIDKVSLHLYSTAKESKYELDSSFINVGWNNITFDLTNLTAVSGGGVDLSNFEDIELRIEFNNTTDTLTGILVDQLYAVPANAGFEANRFAGLKLLQNNQIFNIISSTSGYSNVILTTTDGPDSNLINLNKSQRVQIIDEDWPGSFFYDPDGNLATYFSSQTELDETVTMGDFAGYMDFIDSSDIPDAPGFLVFDFGTESEEGPIAYTERPDNSHLVLDPAYQFQKDHAIGAQVILADDSGHEPDNDGFDYPVYHVSTQQPRITSQNIVLELVAAGVVIRFIVISPEESALFR